MKNPREDNIWYRIPKLRKNNQALTTQNHMNFKKKQVKKLSLCKSNEQNLLGLMKQDQNQEPSNRTSIKPQPKKPTGWEIQQYKSNKETSIKAKNQTLVLAFSEKAI